MTNSGFPSKQAVTYHSLPSPVLTTLPPYHHSFHLSCSSRLPFPTSPQVMQTIGFMGPAICLSLLPTISSPLPAVALLMLSQVRVVTALGYPTGMSDGLWQIMI